MREDPPSRIAVALACAALLTSFACAEADQEPVRGSSPGAAEPSSPRVEFDHAHAAWDEVVRQHVKGDAFDYEALKEDPARLRAYLEALQAVTPEEEAAWTREQRFAFWINAYNAYTVQKVIENYPLESIRDLDKALGLNTVFQQEWIPLRAFDPDGDGELSLDDLENAVIRPRFGDARLHAAINCASYSCPPLRGEAFVAEELDRQLEEQMKAFVGDPKRNLFEEGGLRLSEVFKWFAEDFEEDAGSVREFLLRYVPAERADLVHEGRIRYIDYDWSLNDVPRD